MAMVSIEIQSSIGGHYHHIAKADYQLEQANINTKSLNLSHYQATFQPAKTLTFNEVTSSNICKLLH